MEFAGFLAVLTGSRVRWPLRNQILLPMVCVVLAALLAVSALNAYVTARHARLRIERELADAASTVADAEFPMTDAVLKKMHGLSGAQFVVVDRDGDVSASSAPRESFGGLDRLPSRLPPVLAQPVSLAGSRYFHMSLEMRQPISSGRHATLHILYPEESYRQAWRDAVYPPLIVGSIATVLVIAVGLGIASRVTRPLRKLQIQAGEIAEGHFRSLPVSSRDDEISDLSRSINRMATMLAQYELDVRKNERLCTLGQLGGGIAHQMRNSVTGCRLAVELHARECGESHDESLSVARRQLVLMERYLQRFLTLGRGSERPHTSADLVPVVDNVVSLVAPTARHMGVELSWEPPEGEALLSGDSDALEQMLVNLVVNAVEAAARPEQTRDVNRCPPSELHKKVTVLLSCDEDDLFVEVSDTGDGPTDAVRGTLFDPFVTAKPDGTGLGLSVARQIARAHDGDISWERRNSVTCFTINLSAARRVLARERRMAEPAVALRTVEE
jgi:signal transduction histidine kinase